MAGRLSSNSRRPTNSYRINDKFFMITFLRLLHPTQIQISQEIILMTTETLTLSPFVHLVALLSGGLDPNPPVDAASAFPLELSPKKPSYGYDDEEDED